MAAIALPIRDLEISAKKACIETRHVATYSRLRREDTRIVWQIMSRTLKIRFMFSSLVADQRRYIRELTNRDFNALSDADAIALANALDELVAKERGLLTSAGTLGVELRFWWRNQLRELAQQSEHMDSIAESLRMDADEECSTLLAVAADVMMRA